MRRVRGREGSMGMEEIYIVCVYVRACMQVCVVCSSIILGLESSGIILKEIL